MKLRYKVLSAVLVLAAATALGVALTLSHNSPCAAARPPPAGTPLMKAIVYRCYGSPDVLKLEDIAQPSPADKRMLVKVHAASVNPLDWHYMRGEPYLMRAAVGIGAPDDIHMGVDFSGTVVSVGKDVTRFKPGDEVFGGRTGAFGEYVSVAEAGSVAMKPANVTFEQAAAVPIAAHTALQALRDKGKIQPGQTVLINGASGGVGTFAVQIAKAYGAKVTGVCSTRNLAMVRALGADRVIDYTQEDFTKESQRYDLIIDTRRDSFAIRLPPRIESPWLAGHRWIAGQGPLARTPNRLHRCVALRAFCQPTGDCFVCQSEPGGSRCAARSDAGWQDHPGHRPTIRTERSARSDPLSGARPCPRKSRNQSGRRQCGRRRSGSGWIAVEKRAF